MPTILRFLLLFIVSTGCISMGRPPRASEGDPAWLAAARAMAEERDDYEVRASDGWFRARVPARPLEQVVDIEADAYTLSLDIGSPHPVTCVVMRDDPDPPYFLETASRTKLSQVSREGGGIKSFRVADIDIGAIDRSIFMGIEWAIVVSTADGDRPGAVDLLYGIKDGAGVYCTKVDLGFRQELLAVFAGLLEQLELAEAPEPPAYKEIALFTQNGQPIGIHVETLRIDEKGYRQDEEHYHGLSSPGGNRLAAVTRYDYEWGDPQDLSLIHAGMVRIVNGEMAMNVELAWSRERRGWIVRGEKDEKKIEARLDDIRGPHAILAFVRDVREMLAVPNPVGRVVKIRKWDSLDPSRVEKLTLRITEIIDEEHARAILESPTSRDELVLERETGLMVSTVDRSDPDGVEGKRIYAAGSF